MPEIHLENGDTNARLSLSEIDQDCRLPQSIHLTSKERTKNMRAQCDPSTRHSMTKIHVQCSDRHPHHVPGQAVDEEIKWVQ